ncbi:hypothetical protein N2152v2_009617 [Parachlorella kessleri]
MLQLDTVVGRTRGLTAVIQQDVADDVDEGHIKFSSNFTKYSFTGRDDSIWHTLLETFTSRKQAPVVTEEDIQWAAAAGQSDLSKPRSLQDAAMVGVTFATAGGQSRGYGLTPAAVEAHGGAAQRGCAACAGMGGPAPRLQLAGQHGRPEAQPRDILHL